MLALLMQQGTDGGFGQTFLVHGALSSFHTPHRAMPEALQQMQYLTAPFIK